MTPKTWEIMTGVSRHRKGLTQIPKAGESSGPSCPCPHALAALIPLRCGPWGSTAGGPSAASVTLAALSGPPLHPASSSPHRPYGSPDASLRGGRAFPVALPQPQLGPLLWESRSVTVTEAELSGYFLSTWGAESCITQIHVFLNWNCAKEVPTVNMLIPTAFLSS